MVGQMNFFNVPDIPIKKKIDGNKRNWENAFQKWSNKQSLDEIISLGKCGYSLICDYCEDNSYGRPCVRALNAMCREKCINIDYTKRNFEEIWECNFK